MMQSNKWRTWRITNSVVILFSFFAPWLSMVGGPREFVDAYIYTGFQVIDYWHGLGLSFLSMDSDIQSVIGRGLLTHYFSGLIVLLVYCVINLLLAILGTELTEKTIWTILAFSFLLFGAKSLYKVASLDVGCEAFQYTFWGYWLVLIGLGSSVILEMSSIIWKRKTSEV